MASRPAQVGFQVRLEPHMGPFLKLLGGFELTWDGTPITVPQSAQRLVAYLAMQPRPIPRALVAGVMWGDHDERSSNACLRSTLWRMRSLRGRLIESDGTSLCLSRHLAVDVDDLIRLARSLIAKSVDVDLGVASVERFEPDFLPGWYEDWITVDRERLRQLRVHALEALARRLVEAGRFAEAIEAAWAALRIEPLRESAHLTLIRAHLAEGNRAEAIRQFGRYRELMASELGLSPARSIEEVVEHIP